VFLPVPVLYVQAVGFVSIINGRVRDTRSRPWMALAGALVCDPGTGRGPPGSRPEVPLGEQELIVPNGPE